MSIIFLLIPLSVLLAACFLGAFIWAVRSGQYNDTCTPAMRLLMNDGPGQTAPAAAPPKRAAMTAEGGLASGPMAPGHSKPGSIMESNMAGNGAKVLTEEKSIDS